MAWRVRSLAVCSLLTALAFAQEPGMTTADTKVDLAVNPLGWLGRSLHLWNPVSNFGEVQNQAYGYLWPMGPFFAAGDQLGIPPWVVQRMWWAMLMCLAYTGVVALANRLSIGTPAARIVAGVAFALSPRILTELGTISVEAWPTALVPWVLVPLIGLASGASLRKRVTLSAIVVGCAGGVNATAVFVTVPLALLWLATLPTLRQRLLSMAAWCGAVALATAWWLIPLLLLGRYSPPFLDYIETSAVTTRPTDLTSVLRGTSHWLAYLDGPYGPSMTAGFRLVHEPLLFAATVAVAAIGIAGLARKGMPHRRFLIAAMMLGVAMVTLGHLSELDTMFSGQVRGFLDGAGAPLRNVHKFDAILRLPIVLGIAHFLGVFARAAATSKASRRRAVTVAIASVAAIAGVAAPALAAGVTSPGSYLSVPGYWREAASWLNTNAGNDHVLVVPGARFPRYQWGNPTDEITQPLLEASWGVRNSIPLTPANTIRMLDTIESVLASGAGSAGLAEYLARNDVRYLLLRSDLNYGSTGTARPLQVRQAFQRSPGIAKVMTFGPELGGTSFFSDYFDYGFGLPVHAVEIWEVQRPVSPAGLYDASAVQTVVGGPESLLDLAAAGKLSSAPAILAGDLGKRESLGPVTITDGLRKRELAFGRSQDNTSATMAADEPWLIPGAAHDYLPQWGSQWTSTVRYHGISAISASSSWAQALPLSGSRPEHQPFAAMDGDPATSWRTPPDAPSVGQWFEVTLDTPAHVGQIDLTFESKTDYYPSKVLIVSGPEQVPADVFLGKLSVIIPGAPITKRIRVIVMSVVSTLRVGGGGIGISEMTVQGVTAQRTIVTPPAPKTKQPTDIVLSAAPYVPACVTVASATRCNPAIARGSEDNGRIDRTVTIPSAADYDTRIWARPTPGTALDQTIDDLIAKTRPLGIAPAVTASSRAISDPSGRPGVIADGDPATVWYVGDGDGNASLHLSWPAPRDIAGLKIELDPSIAATRPDRVTVVGADGARGGLIDPDGVVGFDRPMRTTELTIFFLDPFAPARNKDPYTNQWRLLPMAVGEITALPDERAAKVNLDLPANLPCGTGPSVQAGGKTFETKLVGTLRDLVELREMPAEVCGGTSKVRLPAGESRLIANSGSIAGPARLALSVSQNPVVAKESPVTLAAWAATSRRITAGPSDSLRVLVVRENTNPGWKATMGAFTLSPVVLDGWQQGWFVPAGVGGDIVLTFEPEPAYRAAIFSGAGLAAGLVVLAVLPAKRQEIAPRRRRRGVAKWLAFYLGALGLAVAGGPWPAVIIGIIVTALIVYRPFRRKLSTVDRRRVSLTVKALARWLPPALVCLAGVASWQSDYRVTDALPQALALSAVVVLWLSTMSRAVPRTAAKVSQQLKWPLENVVADSGDQQAKGKHEREGANQAPGKQGPPTIGPVDNRDYQRVP
jgi:arabinofuranan 3-O-arabinosyltransferase